MAEVNREVRDLKRPSPEPLQNAPVCHHDILPSNLLLSISLPLSLDISLFAPDGAHPTLTYIAIYNEIAPTLCYVMDTSALLVLPTNPATGLQYFALVVSSFFPGLALLVVSVRVAGWVAASQFAVDDWLVCIAMLLSVTETVLSFFFIKTNLIGIPPKQVPPHDHTQGLIWAYAVQILYNPILALVKSSVLIFLSRLFGQKDWAGGSSSGPTSSTSPRWSPFSSLSYYSVSQSPSTGTLPLETDAASTAGSSTSPLPPSTSSPTS
ncbi:hypothetical protein VTI74DRAFT_8445 [Chaetomium olivicolor]